MDGFGNKSMRKTMVTAQIRQGATAVEVNERGRFSARATTANRFYSGARAIGGEGDINLKDVTSLSKGVGRAKAAVAKAGKRAVVGKGNRAHVGARGTKGGMK
jgi:hypothetical protein